MHQFITFSNLDIPNAYLIELRKVITGAPPVAASCGWLVTLGMSVCSWQHELNTRAAWLQPGHYTSFEKQLK